MSYTSEQRELLDQLDDANFRIGKVKNKLRHLEDDLYALEKHRVDVLKALDEAGFGWDKRWRRLRAGR